MIKSLGVLSAAGLALVACNSDPNYNSVETTPSDLTSGAGYTVKAVNSGKCLDINNNNTTRGLVLEQWTCNGGKNQVWAPTSGTTTTAFKSALDGLCADVTGNSTADGAAVIQWTCGDSTKLNQQWTLVSLGSSKYNLKNKNSGKCMAVVGNSSADGAKIEQRTCSTATDQQFTITSAGSTTPSPTPSPTPPPSGGGSDPCSNPNLSWKTANKTWFTSYPAAGSEECIKYSGCQYEGQFQDCSNTMSKTWVSSHNLVAFFPSGKMDLHDLCLKKGSKTIVVTVVDTCGDSDCGGCCTQNKGSEDALIDVESYTNQRWGVDDGVIQWADLGKKHSSCSF